MARADFVTTKAVANDEPEGGGVAVNGSKVTVDEVNGISASRDTV